MLTDSTMLALRHAYKSGILSFSGGRYVTVKGYYNVSSNINLIAFGLKLEDELRTVLAREAPHLSFIRYVSDDFAIDDKGNRCASVVFELYRGKKQS